ncbi:hypothetical protein Cgig2_019223 [Carnegiea gigantea]|uniref:Aminotransferase-like plant mobile domain-containing protein n=1 Tax=Carnegiea gigantea TaxID=171969 RepID=A0A9Q1GMC5_9CARY|nr:hypothetical protein Cgig2_019223 [Carnegiea gigantea]
MKELSLKMDENVITDLIIGVQTPCKVLTKDYKNYFNATVLEEVNTECCGPEIYPDEEEPSPTQAPYRKKELGINLPISTTKRVLTRFEEPLKQAGIFGAIDVSQFSYHFDANVWQAFCELWGPLTNTLHHGAGEVNISLYDLERIGGLPTFEAVYEEFLSPNKDLTGHNKYPATVAKLLPIHAELCSRFGLPHGKDVIRLETFVMAALMASRQRISLAPTALGYIYHGLRKAASHPDHPGKANTIFPIHYVIGWLAELFPFLYRRRPDSDCPGDFPTLVYYAGLLGSKLSLAQARHIFGDGRDRRFGHWSQPSLSSVGMPLSRGSSYLLTESPKLDFA